MESPAIPQGLLLLNQANINSRQTHFHIYPYGALLTSIMFECMQQHILVFITVIHNWYQHGAVIPGSQSLHHDRRCNHAKASSQQAK